MCFWGCLGSAFAFVLMISFHYLGLQHPIFISFPLFLFGLFNGITVANSIIGGVSATGEFSGTATGITGALQMAAAAIFGTVIIIAGGDESFSLSITIIIVLSLLAIYSSVLTLKEK